MAPKLNNGEGVAFFVQEATLKLKEAPDLHTRRRLGSDGAAENKGRVAAMAYRRKVAVGAWTKCTGNVPFIVVYHVEAIRACTRREGGR
jgi:hypothetical protein